MNTDIYTVYQNYVQMGWDALPIPPDPQGNPTKGPQYPAWQTKAAAREFDPSDFARPNTNLGVLLGGSQHLTDVDCDDPLTPVIAAEILEGALKTRTCVFGRSGKPNSHFFFHADESLPSEKITDPITKGCIVEFRCVKSDGSRGLQTVVPGSVHPSGEQITFAYTPKAIATVKAKNLRQLVRYTAATVLMAKYFPEAEKHYTKRAWARVLHEGGIPKGNAILVVTTAYKHAPARRDARSLSKDTKDVEEVYRLMDSEKDSNLFGFQKLTEFYDVKVLERILTLLGAKRPVSNSGSAFNLDEIGNALRFAAKYKDSARYCPERKCWYLWTGARWEKDTGNQVQELCKRVAEDITAEGHAIKIPSTASEAETEQLENKRTAILKWASKTSTRVKREAMKHDAASLPELIMHPNQFDTHTHLLNCPNGVVDLNTGQITPHDRNLFMTQLCDTEYVPGSKHADWDNVLAVVTRKHPELSGFLQRFVGYTAQGNKGEELIALCHGAGGTGKGTFWGAIQNSLGKDFVCNIAAGSLLRQERGGGNASGDIARLEGARLAIASEFERGSKLQDSFLKLVSGNDTITARRLYQEEQEFSPTFQLVFQSNHRPRFNSADTGNQRRYIEIPFDNVIKDDPLIKQDTELKKRLGKDKDVHKAILAWIVEGCVEWRTNGLQIPDCVKAATQELFKDNDILGEFFSECLIRDPAAKLPVADMRAAYVRHCDQNHTQPFQSRTFNTMLRERGLFYTQATITGKTMKVWEGVRLSPQGQKLTESDVEIVRSLLTEKQMRKQAASIDGEFEE